MTERTLSIIKPDGVSKNLIGEVIKRIEAIDIEIIGIKMILMKRHLKKKEMKVVKMFLLFSTPLLS